MCNANVSGKIVTNGLAGANGETDVHVKSHEKQHKTEANELLDEVGNAEQDMCWVEQHGPLSSLKIATVNQLLIRITPINWLIEARA